MPGDEFVAGLQVEVIGVAEDDMGTMLRHLFGGK
jgi:hypothetical protein